MNMKHENHRRRLCAAIGDAIANDVCFCLRSCVAEVRERAPHLAWRQDPLANTIADALLRQYRIRERGPR